MTESSLITTTLMTPELANFSGNVHGGHILRLVDQVAYACAARFSGHYCVTLSVDRVLFNRPVRVGDLLTMKAQVNRVGRSSMEVGVRIEAQDLQGGPVRHTNSCFLTMVAMKDGVSQEVPLLIAETERQHARQNAAQHRLEQARMVDHLAASAAKHLDLIELAAVAMLLIDSETGKIHRVNNAAVQLLQTPRSELLSSDVWEMHPEEERPEARALWHETASTGFGERVLVHCAGKECQKLRVTSWKIPLATGSLIQRVMRPI